VAILANALHPGLKLPIPESSLMSVGRGSGVAA
jgi:hypothetical protein